MHNRQPQTMKGAFEHTRFDLTIKSTAQNTWITRESIGVGLADLAAGKAQQLSALFILLRDHHADIADLDDTLSDALFCLGEDLARETAALCEASATQRGAEA